MLNLKRSRKNRGQTALEYALVIGVITVGVIFAGQKIFGTGKDSKAVQLMESAVRQAASTIESPGGGQ